ncbi:extracellular solute-binding protein [Kineococcus rhizosphaerae]|uniref:Carbohydrate ABC transporter substrate-binding protein (CUT1 family) n=1 Tax=Kineococcus rhizosphaerae TaxID=559628 RepID=A0A2T0QZB0_9ACTN|nr:extracellular solute-binding protein [Kineococcus rhizosphaerae]PRY11867.1 carbohydrate ABC transporter substrate-binding protein (CUT1 family) [Kineococcus rhizosphaerae]
MRRRSFLTYAGLGAGTVLGTAACGGGSNSGGDSSSGAIKVAYQQWGSGTVMKDYLTTVKSAYEKANSGKTMELTPIVASENDYYTKLQLMMRSPRTSPDVVYEDTFLINSDITAGYLQPLDSFLGKWDEWDQFQDVAKGAAKAADGKTYGIPDGTDTRALWFNKDLLTKAGLSADWMPKTWDDILAACREIKGKVPGVTPINVFAGKAAGEAASMQGFEMLFYGTGSTLYDKDKDKWNVGSPEFVDSLQFIKTIFDEKLAPDPSVALDAQIGTRVSEEFLPGGTLAIDLDGSWQSSTWLDTGGKPWKEWNDVMGQAPMPTKDGSGEGKISMSGGWTWAMTKNASNADDAWKVISTLTSFENNLRYNINSAAVAVRKDVAADPTYTGSNPTLEFFSSLVPVTQYRPQNTDYPRVSNEIQVAMEAVVTGQASPADAAKAYDEAVKGIVGEDKTATL